MHCPYAQGWLPFLGVHLIFFFKPGRTLGILTVDDALYPWFGVFNAKGEKSRCHQQMQCIKW